MRDGTRRTRQEGRVVSAVPSGGTLVSGAGVLDGLMHRGGIS